jgi:hypothetical protein
MIEQGGAKGTKGQERQESPGEKLLAREDEKVEDLDSL